MNMVLSRWELPLQWLRAVGMLVLAILVVVALLPDRSAALDERPLPVKLVPIRDDSGRVPAVSADGSALLLGVDEATRHARAELRFVLPPHDKNSPHWVIWMRRMPVESLVLGVDGAWEGGQRSFLDPQSSEGPMPVGYTFRLPSTWEGEIRVQMEVTALRQTSLRPEVISEELADRYVQEASILATVAYASLLTLGLVTLALYFASHDDSFLSFFVFCLAAVLLLAVSNGHLYMLQSFGVFRLLGGAGTHVASLCFEASALRIMLRYTDCEQVRPDVARSIGNFTVALVLVAGVLLAWREHMDTMSVWLMPALWLTGCATGLYLMLDAWRRRVPLSGAVMLSIVAMVASIAAWELCTRGIFIGTLLTLYGYQVAIMLCASMLGVGLISRISKYREQRDSEQRARADSERRMYREAVRTELLTALQTSLRGASEDDIQPIVFRSLLDHLRRVVPTTTAVAVARGYHGRDTLVVQPAAYLDDIEATIGQRLQTLRRQLSGSIELQRPVTKSEGAAPIAIEALIALPVRPPAWGLIVLERAGATVFHPDELTIVRELARLALLQADEAINALHLRYTAEVDALTGTLNRRSLDQALVRTFQEGHRTGMPLSVLFVDIDHFKAVNDQRGHACGDHCLRELARIVAGQLGEDDVFGRYGGEEFMVILPGRQSEMARATAEQIRIAVENSAIEYQGQAVRLTASIGVASQLAHENAFHAAVERADKALYAAKRGGRNRVSVAPAVFAPHATTM